MLVAHVKGGDRLRIDGLGILEVKKQPARMGRNPATGGSIQIKASKIVFRAAKELKETIPAYSAELTLLPSAVISPETGVREVA